MGMADQLTADSQCATRIILHGLIPSEEVPPIQVAVSKEMWAEMLSRMDRLRWMTNEPQRSSGRCWLFFSGLWAAAGEVCYFFCLTPSQHLEMEPCSTPYNALATHQLLLKGCAVLPLNWDCVGQRKTLLLPRDKQKAPIYSLSNTMS